MAIGNVDVYLLLSLLFNLCKQLLKDPWNQSSVLHHKSQVNACRLNSTRLKHVKVVRICSSVKQMLLSLLVHACLSSCAEPSSQDEWQLFRLLSSYEHTVVCMLTGVT